LRETVRTDEYMELVERVNELRQQAIDQVGEGLTASVARYLPTVTNVKLEKSDFYLDDAVSDIVIEDGSETSIENKGDGVKSLVTLALMQELARHRGKSKNFILAVDEPEAHLHANAVHELQSLFQGLSDGQQVVVATHNPVFVNRDEVGSNVLVRGNSAKSARTIAEIRHALGVQLHDNLDSAETVVLVEGLTDRRLFHNLFCSLDRRYREDLVTGRVVIKATKGTAKLRAMIAKEKSSVSRIIVVLDDDAAGQDEAKRLKDSSVLPPRAIFIMGDPSMKRSEMEDALNQDVYLDALSEEFGRKFTSKHFRHAGRKWSDNFCDAAGKLGLPDPAGHLDQAKICVASAVEKNIGEILKPSSKALVEALCDGIWPKRETAQHEQSNREN
jgi:putative ATP-dependent endonuclease of the OLD family